MSFLGGFNYVRGFDTYRYRGNNALITNVELRQTVYSFKKEHRGIDLIGFGDAGQVWGDNRSTTDPTILDHVNFSSRNWRAGIGGAVQYRHTKVAHGPLRRGDQPGWSTRILFGLTRVLSGTSGSSPDGPGRTMSGWTASLYEPQYRSSALRVGLSSTELFIIREMKR